MAMNLEHDFTVPASVEETWAAFGDIERVAACFPGAAVTAVDGDAFEGTVKVKLGPIALQYKGSGSFVEKDEAARRFRIEAKGKDRRGNGTAGADVVATLTEAGEGTRITVTTDLNITGKPAQFGRGVMQDVSDKLLAQFVDCLSQQLAATAAPAAATPEAPEAAVTDDATPASAAPSPAPAAPTVAPTPSAPPPKADDAIDLGTTVLPVLLRTYWPHLLAAVAGVVVLRWLWRRRRR